MGEVERGREGEDESGRMGEVERGRNELKTKIVCSKKCVKNEI